MREAGFKNKKELAKAMNLPYNSVNNWGSGADYPNYCEPFLNALIKAKKYDEALKSGFCESENIEALRLENTRLRAELEEYEELKRVLKKVVG